MKYFLTILSLLVFSAIADKFEIDPGTARLFLDSEDAEWVWVKMDDAKNWSAVGIKDQEHRVTPRQIWDKDDSESNHQGLGRYVEKKEGEALMLWNWSDKKVRGSYNPAKNKSEEYFYPLPEYPKVPEPTE